RYLAARRGTRSAQRRRGVGRAGRRRPAQPGRRGHSQGCLWRGRTPVSPWRLLLTRPEEDCQALAQSLAAAGIASSCLPLLAIEPVVLDARQGQRLANLRDYQAIIVVSKPAARLLLEQLAGAGLPPPRRGWFTVGAATARILQD